MDLEELIFTPVPVEKYDLLTREELITFLKVQGELVETLQKDKKRLLAKVDELKQRSFFVGEQLVTIKNKLFGSSSEKEPSKEDRKKNHDRQRKKRIKVQLPSQRYPDAPLIERDVTLDCLPNCSCCGEQMSDSGMTENAEFLTVIPKQYLVVRQKRHKYRCEKCHGDLMTAPAPPKIRSGSGYSDEMVIDVAMSKYCDLIPVERYATMAGREGLEDLPPQSLIEQTHYLADFVEGAYQKTREEVLEASVLHADETPHRMLEENSKKSWYLWGFSTQKSSYFEIRNTRSGEVASELLNRSRTQYLVSDVFSGYAKAVQTANEERKKTHAPPIYNVYCHAHARRKFKEALNGSPEEAQKVIDLYRKIYRLEKIAQARPPDRPDKRLRVRKLMIPLFDSIRMLCREVIGGYSSKSALGKAASYFLKNDQELTRFLEHPDLPIDNNAQERQLRDPVIGRKTWYGNHSRRGAKTTAILFSLVQSCKLNHVNPRDYFKSLVRHLHEGQPPYTPAAFADNVR